MSTLSRLLLLTAFLAGCIAQAEAQQSSKGPVWSIYVEDMHCKHCAQKIGGSLYTVKGVARVAVRFDEKVLIVTPSQGKVLSEVDLWEAVEKVDFKPQKIVSPRGTFLNKPKRGSPQTDAQLSGMGSDGCSALS